MVCVVCNNKAQLAALLYRSVADGKTLLCISQHVAKQANQTLCCSQRQRCSAQDLWLICALLVTLACAALPKRQEQHPNQPQLLFQAPFTL